MKIKDLIKATGAEVFGGDFDENQEVKISTDTRTIQKGDFYLPLKGASFDGEKFINQAIEKGAVGAFCTETSPLTPLLEGEGKGTPHPLTPSLKGRGNETPHHLTPAHNGRGNGIPLTPNPSPTRGEGNDVPHPNLPPEGKEFALSNLAPRPAGEGAVVAEAETKLTNAGEGAVLQEKPILLKVPNTLTAYLQLANYRRNQINPTVVAITGSSGKTTTKELVASVLSEKFKTFKTPLNHNNEIGFCQTIFEMPDDTQVLVLEMGMRGLGEIELLSKYSEPDITIIANVGTAHIGRLGSRENIAKAKCEIVKYQRGKYFIAHDDELIKKTVEFDGEKTYYSISNVEILEKSANYSKFVYNPHPLTPSLKGRGNEAPLTPDPSPSRGGVDEIPLTSDPSSTRGEGRMLYSHAVSLDGLGDCFELNVGGDYNIENALAAINTGLKLGMGVNEIQIGLKKYHPIEKRWESVKAGGFEIINDSYNANPESMRAFIDTIFEHYKNYTIVLGDMGELGENEVQYHKELGMYINSKKNLNKNAQILSVGVLSENITKEITNCAKAHFNTLEEAANFIKTNVKKENILFLKASRSMKFERIIDFLN